MDRKSCFHGRFLGPHIEFMHSAKISCLEAAEFFRASAAVWGKICERYGAGEVEFWVIFDYNPENPVIASCCRGGVYFNLALERTNLTPAQDVTSRLIEELYQLHAWRVKGIIPEYEVAQDEKIGLTDEELLAYYSLPHKFAALEVLCEITSIPYWKQFRARVIAHLEGS